MEDYDSYILHDEFMSEKNIQEYKKILRNITGKKILDIGCGSGVIGSILVDKNDVYGIDSSEKAIALAQKRGIKAVTHNVTNRLPFDENLFDVVICKDVFEHIENPLFVLMEINRVLKNGGILLTSVPNQFNILDRIRMLFGKGIVVQRWFPGSKEWNFPHLRFFTREGFKKFLESANFKIIDGYPQIGAFHIPVIRIKMATLAKVFPALFSTGITFKCVHIKGD